MVITALDTDGSPPAGPPGCWCCGDRTVQASLLRLEAHAEVGICFKCVRVLARRKRQIERRTRGLPPDRSLWQRVRYRAGFGRC